MYDLCVFSSVMQHAFQPPKTQVQPRGKTRGFSQADEVEFSPVPVGVRLGTGHEENVDRSGERLVFVFWWMLYLKGGVGDSRFWETYIYTVYIYSYVCVCVIFTCFFWLWWEFHLKKGYSFLWEEYTHHEQSGSRMTISHVWRNVWPCYAQFLSGAFLISWETTVNALRPYRIRYHNSLFWRLLVSEKNIVLINLQADQYFTWWTRRNIHDYPNIIKHWGFGQSSFEQACSHSQTKNNPFSFSVFLFNSDVSFFRHDKSDSENMSYCYSIIVIKSRWGIGHDPWHAHVL